MDDSLAETLRRVEALRASLGPPDGSVALAPDAPTEDLRRMVGDRTVPPADRRAAFSALADRLRGEPDLSEMILGILGEPDPVLAPLAIACAPPFDSRVMDRIRSLLDDPTPEIWEAAASALSRKKDRSILPRMLSWSREGDLSHRRAGLAAVAFLLIPEEHLAVVEAICEDGPRDDEDEAVLVEALRVAESRVAFWRKATGEAD